MFKTVASAVAALVCVAMASPSHAQTFSPSVGGLTGYGTITIQQATTTLNCKLATPLFNVTTPTTLDIPIRSLSPGDLPCHWVRTEGPWSAAVVPGSTTMIQLTFGFNPFASCYGTIIAAWSNTTQTATFNNAVLLGSPSCTVSGSITISSLQIV